MIPKLSCGFRGEVLENMQSPWHFSFFFCFLSFFIFVFFAEIGNIISCMSSRFISPCFVHLFRQFALAKYGKPLTFIDIRIKTNRKQIKCDTFRKNLLSFPIVQNIPACEPTKKKLPFDNCFFCKIQWKTAPLLRWI